MNEIGTTMPPSKEMPFTFLMLPRELRDEIYTYAALSSSFNFLCTCHQLNEEGTPLLYKHGIYRMRAMTLRREHLPTLSKRPPFHLIQNLYIAMPPISLDVHKSPNYEIPRSTISLLEHFRGTEVRRRVCHFDLQDWTLSAGMAEGLGGLVGFEVVRVEVQVKLHDGYCLAPPVPGETRLDRRVRLIDERLGLALGKARWEEKFPENLSRLVLVLVAEFRPRESTS